MKSRRSMRTRARRSVLALLATAGISLTTIAPAIAGLPNTSTPVLTLNHLLHTSPFDGSKVSMNDNEDSVYVPKDNAVWLADDDGRHIYEVDATTGALEQTYGKSDFDSLPEYGGGQLADASTRDKDFESLAYDASTDTLYAYSGIGSTTLNLPGGAFRLTRVNGVFTPTDYQPLPSGSDFSGASWNPTDKKIYVGLRKTIQSYDYATNSVSTGFSVSGLNAITGLGFTSDGNDLFVTRSSHDAQGNPVELLSRVDWASKSLVSGWTFDLTPFGVLDARGVALVNDQFYVSDGYDARSAGDPMNHADFVFDVSAYNGTVVAPVASFTTAPGSSNPLTVKFTDTSQNSPTSWKWQFGDALKSTSTQHNPVFTYPAPGTYTVTMTASNAAGSNTVTQLVNVPQATAPVASFTATPTGGNAPLAVSFTDTSTGSPTSWAWDFGDGSTSTEQSPTHTFLRPGSYTVTLTATDGKTNDTASLVVQARDLRAPTGRFAATPARAHVRHTKVAVVQKALHDDFTPARSIRRVVRWGDGTAAQVWRPGTTLRHVYRKRGVFHPQVQLTDRAGNHRTVWTNRVFVRR